MQDAVRHLRADHVAFDERFADLRARAQTDDWRYLDAVWDGFVEDIGAHFDFEEKVLFPELRAQGADDAALVEQLVAEHAEIRSTLMQLGIQIQLHRVRATTIDALVDRLRKHAALENQRLYAWAERQAAAAQPAGA